MATKIALVTGGNKGIGINIVKQLVYKKWTVIMGSRNLDNAKQALDAEFDDQIFPKQNVDLLQLDISDESSIKTAKEYIKQCYNSKINVLVNNAGIAFKSKQFSDSVINQTLNTNYYGTVNLTNAISPYVTDRIFFMGSRAGALQQYSKARQAQFLAPDLDENAISKLVEEFKSDVNGLNPDDFNDELKAEKKGWTLNAYAMSKACLGQYSRILARDLIERERRRVWVGTYCPGHCRTDMTRGHGDRSPVEGAYGISTMATMLLDHEEENEKKEKMEVKDGEIVPFDTPTGCFWTAFYAKQGDLNSIEIEAIDWVNPAQTLSWGNLLHNLVIRKGKGVLSIDEQASP